MLRKKPYAMLFPGAQYFGPKMNAKVFLHTKDTYPESL